MRAHVSALSALFLALAFALAPGTAGAARIHDLPPASSGNASAALATLPVFVFPVDAIVPVDLGNLAILGQPMATREQCVAFLLAHNPAPALAVTARQLVDYYYDEGAREGVRPDVAFAQAVKETGFFRYGGDVAPEQNNFCGLGAVGGHVRGACFATPLDGVRAHIQHLLAYASTRLPEEELIDPRYFKVREMWGLQTLDDWTALNGRWAVPGTWYGESVMALFTQLVATAAS